MTIGDIINIDTYNKYSHQFFSYYDLSNFDSYNLSNFNLRILQLKSFYDENLYSEYSIGAANLVIGYNTLYSTEELIRTGVSVSLFKNIWNQSFTSTQEKIITKLKNYLIFTSKPLTYDIFKIDYNIFQNITSYPSLDIITKAAFEATPYFYRDFKLFLTPEDRETLEEFDTSPTETKMLQSSLEDIQETILKSNKQALIGFLGLSAISLIVGLSKR